MFNNSFIQSADQYGSVVREQPFYTGDGEGVEVRNFGGDLLDQRGGGNVFSFLIKFIKRLFSWKTIGSGCDSSSENKGGIFLKQGGGGIFLQTLKVGGGGNLVFMPHQMEDIFKKCSKRLFSWKTITFGEKKIVIIFDSIPNFPCYDGWFLMMIDHWW